MSAVSNSHSLNRLPQPLTSQDAAENIKGVVEFLLMKKQDSSGLVSKKLLHQVFYKCDSSLLAEFSKALQSCLQGLDLSAIDQKQELFIDSVISLIPYTYPKQGQRFNLPIKGDDGRYSLRPYICSQIIPMTISNAITPLHAYCFAGCQDNRQLLLFTGTTFPSGGGFLNSLMADFTPFSSVGKLPFNLGFSALKQYFDSHHDVHVYGMSLGGALCLHALRHFETKIASVHATVPPGLHLWDGFNNNSQVDVNIQVQKGDVVSMMGYFPEHEKVKIFELSCQGSFNKGLYAHARQFAGANQVQISQIDPKLLNRSFVRRVLTIKHIALGWLIFLSCIPALFIYQIKHVCIQTSNLIQTKLKSPSLLPVTV